MSLVVSRTAGIIPERTLSGAFSRRGAADAPLLYTAGGRTELHLELLFDAPLHSAMQAKLRSASRRCIGKSATSAI